MGILVKKGNGTILKFIDSCLSGLQTLNNKFTAFTTETREDLKYNAQAIYLSKRLNDLYDYTNRGIYIVNIQSIHTKYMYRNSELQTDYLYRNSESQDFIITRLFDRGLDYNYIIKVPISLTYSEDNFNATVIRYNFVGKRYIIETY